MRRELGASAKRFEILKNYHPSFLNPICNKTDLVLPWLVKLLENKEDIGNNVKLVSDSNFLAIRLMERTSSRCIGSSLPR